MKHLKSINEHRFPIDLKVSMIIFSHLSDISEGMMDIDDVRTRCNFIKYLIMEYPNTDTYINADDEFEKFKNKFPKL